MAKKKKKERLNIKEVIKRPGSLRELAKKEGAINEHGKIDIDWVREKAKERGLVGYKARFYLNVLHPIIKKNKKGKKNKKKKRAKGK